MEHFVVSARKYRPQTFKDVVGQQAITNTLLNAIKHNHLAQALLFTGPRGVGKTTCARILARMINQDTAQRPDEDFAFNIFELDAASNNSVDDIRNLIDQVRIPPQVGNYKVYIIDEVHMLSTSAFNAFLKTLEEPPKHAIFILATTEKHKIIPTILSRCQIFDFKRITVSDVKDYLAYIAEQEGVMAEDDALHIIAQKADGAMRDALSIYDRVISFSGNTLTRQAVTENLNVLDYETYLSITDLLLENNIPQLLMEFNAILAQGFDGNHFIAGLASHFRDLLVCKNPKTIALLDVGELSKTKYFEQSQKTSQEFLLKGIELANDCDLKYRNSRNQRLLVELCLMQLASITYGGEKKNPEQFIIPASDFKDAATRPVRFSAEEKKVVRENEYSEDESAPAAEVQVPVLQSTKIPELETAAFGGLTDSKNVRCEPETAVAEEPAAPTAEPVIPSIAGKKVSGLSLKSIRAKKEILARKQGDEAKVEEQSEKFSETQMQAAWDEYIHRLKNKGEKILASIMETDLPRLNGTSISIELPAETMKTDLERGQGPLMAFLRKKLRNTHIELDIEVNEKSAKKYAFTNIEKYNKLKEKNPLIDKLRTTFDLDI